MEHLFSIQPKDASDKIATVKHIFIESGAAQRTKEEIALYTQKAFATLAKLNVSEEKKGLLKKFGESLMQREV